VLIIIKVSFASQGCRLGTKHRIKSHGTALVKVRWKFSDEALWIAIRLLTFSEGGYYANVWLD